MGSAIHPSNNWGLKDSGGFNGIRTYYPCDTASMLYQLSFQATHLGAGQFVGLICQVSIKRKLFKLPAKYEDHFFHSSIIRTSLYIHSFHFIYAVVFIPCKQVFFLRSRWVDEDGKRHFCHGTQLTLIHPPSTTLDGTVQNACPMTCLLTAT